MSLQHHNQNRSSIDLFMLNDGALVVLGKDNKPKLMNDYAHAMAFMWANCSVQATEFKRALKELKKNRHTRANFGVVHGVFMFSDMAELPENYDGLS